MIYLLENEDGQWMKNCIRETGNENKPDSYTVITLELTDNVEQAYQFARRSDAESHLSGDDYLVKCGMLVTEHELENEMSRQHHYLKTESEYYQDVERGKKKFELRKNDRNFKKHDLIYLLEVVNGIETGRSLPPVEVKYILMGGKFGLKKGYCIINW